MIRHLFHVRQHLSAVILLFGVAAAGCTSTNHSWREALTQPTSAVRLASLQEAASPESIGQPAFLTAYSGARPPQGFHGVCERYPWACSRQPGKISDEEALQIATRINRRVNARIRGISDPSLYGERERWTLPERGAGDCEDYALLKKKLLLEAGLPAKMLLLATGLNREAEPHAVLVLRLRTGDVILDNSTSAAKPWRATGYTFLKIQKPDNPHAWSAVLLGPFASRT